MTEGPRVGMRNGLLVWIIGLTLGIAAGAATAMLLMPTSAEGSALNSPISQQRIIQR